MSEVELVKMSPKGQLVVPKSIREQENFSPTDRFIPFPVKNGVLFKKVALPNAEKEFETLANDIRNQFRKRKVSSKDVDGAVGWARKR